MTGFTAGEMGQYRFIQPGCNAVQLDAGVQPASTRCAVGGLPLPIRQADARSRRAHTGAALAGLPAEPGTLAPRGLQVARQQ